MLKEEDIFEFIRTNTGLKRFTKELDPQYAKRKSQVMAKRQARDTMKNVRQARRREAQMKSKGFPNVSKLFKEDLEAIINDQNVMAPRGSTFDKIAARQDAAAGRPAPQRPVRPAPPAQDPAARAAAFEKQKAIWAQQAKAKAAALPPGMQKRKPMGEQKAKPDYLDMDKDGNKKESMKKAIKDKQKGESVGEQYSKKVQARMAAIGQANKELEKRMAAKPKQPPVMVRKMRRPVPVPEQMAAGVAGPVAGAEGGSGSTGSGAISANNITRSDNATVKKMRRPVK